jgi:hypothetical protein
LKSIKFLLFFILLCSYTNEGMHKEIFFPGPLSEIEKLIVWNKIKKLGKETILDMIHIDNPNIHDEFTNLPTLTKIRKNKTDYLSLSIISTIEQQEKEHTYAPEQISVKKDGVWHITLPNNYFGNYTRYWHKKDSRGEYIELYSLFTYKPALMEVIHAY